MENFQCKKKGTELGKSDDKIQQKKEKHFKRFFSV